MSKLTQKRLSAAAKDMNKVMGLKPEIDLEVDDKTLSSLIRDNAAEVEADDKFKDDTWKILDELGVATLPDRLKKDTATAKKKASARTTESKSRKSTNPKKKTAAKSEEESEKKKTTTKKKTAAKKKSGPGIIASIIEFIEAGPITKEGILKKLAKRFSDRPEIGMKRTINIQVPGRLQVDKGLKLTKDDKDRWSITGKSSKKKTSKK